MVGRYGRGVCRRTRVTLLDTGDPLNDERAQASPEVHMAGGEAMLLDTSSGTALLQRLCAAGIALGRIRHVFGSRRPLHPLPHLTLVHRTSP